MHRSFKNFNVISSAPRHPMLLLVCLLGLVLSPAAVLASSGCVSGSGTCSDSFTGNTGTSLTAYNASWVKLGGSADVYLTGDGSVAISGQNYATYMYAPSSSDTSQITVNPSSTQNAYTRDACVRMSSSGSYCVGFGGVSNGSYVNCYVTKSGQWIGTVGCAPAASASHTLTLTASGRSSVTLSVSVDGQQAGTVTDGSNPLTGAGSGFTIVGDGTPANSGAGAWQDYVGTLNTASTDVSLSQIGSFATSSYGCPSGSGSCYDTFTGTKGTLLTNYNNSWTLISGTAPVFLTGNTSVEIAGTSYAYYAYTASRSDTAQVTVSPSNTKISYSREACVRLTPGRGGYCVGFGQVVNGYYLSCYVEKGGQFVGGASCAGASASLNHALAITASGSSPVRLQVYMDGVLTATLTDKSGTLQTSHPGFALAGDGSPVNSDSGMWRDSYVAALSPALPAASAPVFSPAAGSYAGTQTISISSSTAGAALYYTTDGSAPTTSSKVYSGPVTVASSGTLRAVAVATGFAQSTAASASYTIMAAAVASPTFSLATNYSGAVTTVRISDAANGAAILYCQDTSNTCLPTLNYVGGVNFAATGYIRAQAVLNGYSPSAIASWHGTLAAVQIVTDTCPQGTQYQAYAGCTITVSGGAPPYTFGWSKTAGDGMVEGLSLDRSTGKISGTVYGQGVYQVAFTVTDATNTTTTKQVNIPVRGDNTLAGCTLFPADSIWHLNVANLPVDTSSYAPIAPAYASSSLHLVFGSNLNDGGMPFLRVPYNQQMTPVNTTMYQSYFTSGPYPTYAPVEGTQNAGSNGDRHTLILQTAGGGNGCKLWEMWQGAPNPDSSWTDSSNAMWDLSSYDMLPQDNGSTDAAGLPVLPLLWNYDEVAGGCAAGQECGVVKHPGRLTLNHTMNYHVWPATAQAGLGYCVGGYQDENRLLSQSNPPSFCSGTGPMGEIYRLKSSATTPAACVGHPQAQVLITAMRNYGLIIADNGITGGVVATADSRWNDDDLACLTAIKLSDFEPVNVSSKMVDVNSSRVYTQQDVTRIDRPAQP